MKPNMLVLYRETEREVKQLNALLAALEKNPVVAREFELEAKLKELLDEYGFSPQKALSILGVSPAAAMPPAKREVVARKYRNPHTGEEIMHKGGPHAILAGWRKQYGADVVRSWVKL